MKLQHKRLIERQIDKSKVNSSVLNSSEIALLVELSDKLSNNAEYRDRHDNRSNAWFFLSDPPLMTGA